MRMCEISPYFSLIGEVFERATPAENPFLFRRTRYGVDERKEQKMLYLHIFCHYPK